MRRFMLVLCATVIFVLATSISYAALSDDIVLFMSFNDGSGTNVSDSSIYGNNGVATVEGWVAGIHSGGFEFDGANTAITVEASDELRALKAPMSVGYWIKILMGTTWPTVVEMEAAPEDRTGGWKSGTRVAKPVFTTYGIKDHLAAGNLGITVWAHFACTFDGERAKFYLNGNFNSEETAGGDIDVSQSPMLNIGASAGVPGQHALSGVLDDLWISNTIKTQEEIQELMNMENIDLVAPVKPIEKASITWGALKR